MGDESGGCGALAALVLVAEVLGCAGGVERCHQTQNAGAVVAVAAQRSQIAYPQSAHAMCEQKTGQRTDAASSIVESAYVMQILTPEYR